MNQRFFILDNSIFINPDVYVQFGVAPDEGVMNLPEKLCIRYVESRKFCKMLLLKNKEENRICWETG